MTKNIDLSGMKIWVILLEKEPRPDGVFAEDGENIDIEWVIEQGSYEGQKKLHDQIQKREL